MDDVFFVKDKADAEFGSRWLRVGLALGFTVENLFQWDQDRMVSFDHQGKDIILEDMDRDRVYTLLDRMERAMGLTDLPLPHINCEIDH